MVEHLSSQLEDRIDEQFGKIIGWLTLAHMPEVYKPNDVPADYIEQLVGIELPVRSKLLAKMTGITIYGINAVENLQKIHDENLIVPIFGLDIQAELDESGLSHVVDTWHNMGTYTLELPAQAGNLKPLPRYIELAA